MILAYDRHLYAERALAGMSQPIVLLMVMAWLLAGVLGTLMSGSGFVEALVAVAARAGVQGGGFVATAFLISCLVSTATGTSLGTIILCGPLLYPAGGPLGAEPAMLIGALLGGATFGDNISPVSDTTIASVTTQGAEMGRAVKTRLRYAVPAATVAAVVFAVFGGRSSGEVAAFAADPASGSMAGLPMIIVPLVVLGLLLARRHLLEGLLFGVATAVVLALTLDLIQPSELFYIDVERFSGRGLVVDGLERGLGISVFTLLLMGLVSTLESSGVLERLVRRFEDRSGTERGAEAWIVLTASAAVLLTTHSVVALLAVGSFTRRLGSSFGISPVRRANLLDLTVCTFPFLVPYCIPTVLAASMTASGAELGMPRVSALTIGLHNFHSWGLLVILWIAVVTGFGRRAGQDPGTSAPEAHTPSP